LRGKEKKAMALSECEKISLYEELARDKREALNKLRNAQVRIKEMEQQTEKMTAAYEAKLEEERWYKAELENDIQYRNKEFERQYQLMKQKWLRRVGTGHSRRRKIRD